MNEIEKTIPTPRCDSLLGYPVHMYVPLAKELERELAETIAQRDQLKADYHQPELCDERIAKLEFDKRFLQDHNSLRAQAFDSLAVAFSKVGKERDEWRELCAEMADVLDRVAICDDGCKCSKRRVLAKFNEMKGGK